jgi:hypothetical protein
MGTMLWKIHGGLSDEAKSMIIQKGWSFYEDGHSQIYAIVSTDYGVEREMVEEVVKPAVIYDIL